MSVAEKTVYFIEGDGIGPEVWKAARPVLDAAVAKAGGGRKLVWKELLAGEKAFRETGRHLPEATMEALKTAELAMKGPLGTPVGKGFRSLNVTLRQVFDLYACIRPIRYFQGIESPVKRPDLVDIVVFRENTEDVYAGIEWAAGTPEAKKLIAFLRDEMGANVDEAAGVGIKPMTEKGSKRLVEKALRFAVEQKKPNVTLVHKGNIMKYTEGAFRAWGYDLAREKFGDVTMTEAEAAEGGKKPIVVKDRIADAMFQEVLIRPEQYSVVATTNLNGDYISDALAAQVGGLGLAPGVNMSEKLAFFEATHGTAPGIAGQDKANPGSLLLSGTMLLEHVGWHDAAALIHKSVKKAIAAKRVTVDLASQIPGATAVGCAEFGEILLKNL
ncbi:MAG: NADP-dependent isocitrate dehydrogenase [Desulfovibrio aminophilus]|uniref:NADP-dependent isocitrate dehydrogenase n=1 Tax=Desulfovibrio aminophilus TaxID=81425 RepID=UPI0039E772F1